MKSKAKFLTLVAGSLMALGMMTGCGGQPSVTKFQVTYETSSAYYRVDGINNEGYEKGAAVSFTVTALLPEQKVVSQVKEDGTTLVADGSGKYNFTMPEKNVALTVSLTDVDHYVLSATGNAQVDETVVLSLTNNDTPIVNFTVEPATEADKEYYEIKDSSKPLNFFLKKEGTCNLVAKVGGQQVATLALAITKSSIVTIKEAFDKAITEAPCNGTSGAKSAKTTSNFTIAGKIVYISSNTATDSGYSYNVLIDDGTDIAILLVFNSSKSVDTADWKLGDTVKTTCKFTNYYGIFEGIGTSSTSDKQSSLYYDEIVKVEKEFTVHQEEAMTAAQFDAYYNVCKTDGAKGATTYHSVKRVYLPATGAGEEDDRTFYTLAGSTCECAGKLNCTPAFGQTLEDKVGTLYDLHGYMIGCNTGKQYGSFAISNENNAPVTAWNFDDTDTVFAFIGAETPITYTITAPAGARGVNKSFSVLDPTVCSYDGEVVNGLKDGFTTITLDLDGVSHSLNIQCSSEKHPCTGVSFDDVGSSVSINAVSKKDLTYTVTSDVAPCTDAVSFEYDSRAITVEHNKRSKKVTITPILLGKTNLTIKCGDKSSTIVVDIVPQKIADLGNASAGDKADVYGYVSALYFNGFFLGDGANGIFVYTNSAPEVKVNDVYEVKGDVAFNYGALQIASPTLVKCDAAPSHISTPVITNITDEQIGTFTQADQGKHVKFQGVVTSASGTTNMTYVVKVGSKNITIYSHSKYEGTADFKTKAKLGYTVTVNGYLTCNNNNYQVIAPVCEKAEAIVSGIEMNIGSLQIALNGEYQLSATLLPKGVTADIVWTVEDSTTGHFSVDQTGKVKTTNANINETATIRATSGSKSTTCIVIAVEKPSVEEKYVSLLPAKNKEASKTNLYTSTIAIENDDAKWSVTSWSNNNWAAAWNDELRCGRKSNASTAMISNTEALADKVTKVVLSLRTATIGKYSAYLEIDSSADFSSTSKDYQKIPFEMKAEDIEIKIANRIANGYYRIVIDMTEKTGSNGSIAMTNLSFYHMS